MRSIVTRLKTPAQSRGERSPSTSSAPPPGPYQDYGQQYQNYLPSHMQAAARHMAAQDAVDAVRTQALASRVQRGGRDPNLPAGAARWITVAGIGTDVGTTTVTALLSSAYAAHRRYRIVVVDANPVGGSLRTRLATRGAATVAEIGSAATEMSSFTRLAPYLDQTAEGAWGVTGAATTPPELNQIRDAMTALSGFFAVGVLDAGPVGQPVADLLLESAHARLLVAPVTAEGVLSCASALDWLASRQDTGMRSHCTVALVSTVRNPGTDVGWAARLLTGRGARVFPIPYDVALSARRISAASVSDGAAAAVRRLSTELLSRAARSSQSG